MLQVAREVLAHLAVARIVQHPRDAEARRIAVHRRHHVQVEDLQADLADPVRVAHDEGARGVGLRARLRRQPHHGVERDRDAGLVGRANHALRLVEVRALLDEVQHALARLKAEHELAAAEGVRARQDSG